MGDDKQKSKDLPVSGRLKLKFASLEALVNRLGRHICQDGVFIPTENPQLAGTLLALQIVLQTDEVIIDAQGEVLWTRRSAKPQEPTGMAFRFLNLTEPSRKFVWAMAKKNQEAGLPTSIELNMDVAPNLSEQQTELSAAVKASKASKVSKAPNDGVIIGIDFGTTNSCVGYMDGNTPKLLPSDKGALIVPSVVAINDKNKMLIGVHAKEQSVINPKKTISGAKRFVGRNFRSPFVREHMPKFTYKMHPDENDEILVQLGDSDYKLPQICAFILESLKESAEGILGAEVSRAIITVPAHFAENQRAAIKEAARIAGLQVDLLLNEPTAAALAYGFNKEYEKRILVFDLGGGTFDVSILEVSAHVFEVKGTSGNAFLGGLDFDQRLVDFIADSFEKKHKLTTRDNDVVMQRITSAAENAKIQLSFQDEAEVNLPFLMEKRRKPVDLKMTIQKSKLEELTKDLVDKTIEICGAAIHSMGLLPQDIDDVLLVGGQTRMPLIREKIRDYFGKEPSKGAHPDEAVALGAALLGGSLKMIDGPLLLDVLSLPIGMRGPGGEFKPIFDAYTPLPCRKRFDMQELPYDMKTNELGIYQGVATVADENEYLGDIKLLFPTLGDGLHDIFIEFELTREGILKLRARHQPSGRAETLKLEIMKGLMPLVQEPEKAERSGIFKKLFGN